MQYVTIHANSTSATLMAGISCATKHISLPGHDDIPLRCDYSLPHLREYVIGQVGVEETVFVGNSVGGMLAYEVADITNTKAIITVGIPPLNYDVLDGFMLDNRYTALACTPDLSDAEVVELADGLVECPQKRKTLAEAIRQCHPGVREGLTRSIIGGDLRDERVILRELDIPMLFITCKQDVIINNRKFDDLDFGEVIEVDAGHLLPFEQPERFNRIVEEFLVSHELL